MEVPVVRLKKDPVKGETYSLLFDNFRAILDDFEDEHTTIVAIIGPEKSGRYMIAGGIKSYLEQNLNNNSVLKDRDVFSIPQPERRPLGISVLNSRIRFNRNQSNVILMMVRIARDMNVSHAQTILFYASALSSVQIFNLPHMLTDWDKARIKDVTSWNSKMNSKETKRVVILRDVLLHSYSQTEESIGSYRISIYPFPAPGEGIFNTVPSTTQRFREIFTKFLRDEINDPNDFKGKLLDGRHLTVSELLILVQEIDPRKDEESIEHARNILRALHQYKSEMRKMDKRTLADSQDLEKWHVKARDSALSGLSGNVGEKAQNLISNEYQTFSDACNRIQKIIESLHIQESRALARPVVKIQGSVIQTFNA